MCVSVCTEGNSMKKVFLIGTSGGTREGLSAEALGLIDSAGLVIGAERLINNIHPKRFGTKALTASTEILAAIRETKAEQVAVLFSGDTGFFSGAGRLISLLFDSKIDYEVIPGLSSLSLAAAAFGLSYEDVKAVSLHGRVQDMWTLKRAVIAGLMSGKPVFFLTDSYANPAAIASCIKECGCPELMVHIGENLGSPNQGLFSGTAAEAAEGEFSPLSVVFTEAAPVTKLTAAGLPDGAFLRKEGVPMTKRFARSAILSALEMQSGDVVWDIGAGTGSVSVEAALLNPTGMVCSIECEPERAELVRENRARFHAFNMEVISGTAPEVLSGLPVPDRVFIGGSDGNLSSIVSAVLAANPRARMVLSAVTLETIAEAQKTFAEKKVSYEAVTIDVAESKEVGTYHMMRGQNPVTLFIVGGPEAEG